MPCSMLSFVANTVEFRTLSQRFSGFVMQVKISGLGSGVLSLHESLYNLAKFP